MLAEEGEELKMTGLSDDDIDRSIEGYWNTPYEMDGETHTIREWSSIYGNQQLKKKLKEPLEEKYKRQMEAEPVEVKVGDMKNIEETCLISLLASAARRRIEGLKLSSSERSIQTVSTLTARISVYQWYWYWKNIHRSWHC